LIPSTALGNFDKKFKERKKKENHNDSKMKHFKEIKKTKKNHIFGPQRATKLPEWHLLIHFFFNFPKTHFYFYFPLYNNNSHIIRNFILDNNISCVHDLNRRRPVSSRSY
jgi:hypothetical protein